MVMLPRVRRLQLLFITAKDRQDKDRTGTRDGWMAKRRDRDVDVNERRRCAVLRCERGRTKAGACHPRYFVDGDGPHCTLPSRRHGGALALLALPGTAQTFGTWIVGRCMDESPGGSRCVLEVTAGAVPKQVAATEGLAALAQGRHPPSIAQHPPGSSSSACSDFWAARFSVPTHHPRHTVWWWETGSRPHSHLRKHKDLYNHTPNPPPTPHPENSSPFFCPPSRVRSTRRNPGIPRQLASQAPPSPRYAGVQVALRESVWAPRDSTSTEQTTEYILCW